MKKKLLLSLLVASNGVIAQDAVKSNSNEDIEHIEGLVAAAKEQNAKEQAN